MTDYALYTGIKEENRRNARWARQGNGDII